MAFNFNFTQEALKEALICRSSGKRAERGFAAVVSLCHGAHSPCQHWLPLGLGWEATGRWRRGSLSQQLAAAGPLLAQHTRGATDVMRKACRRSHPDLSKAFRELQITCQSRALTGPVQFEAEEPAHSQALSDPNTYSVGHVPLG
ncbi:hypothetical protein SKAU_G00375610 [Synaphobranchus kaupii]|uniref:Uncharacterized protein n=1 Tax=Synaphobranchus kaupii TaxID=118154 RepID=A0A9Q1IFF7_SYNKA|nr:hypothetical protein SKAU_G00375610 [Synaphobranchus kaupii]